MVRSEASSYGRFVVDLPDANAAIAISGLGQKNLQRLQALTGASFVMRGLELEISGRPSQVERATALVELTRSLWQEGQAVSHVDLQAAMTSLDTGRSEAHAQLGDFVLARSQRGKLLRPRTLRQKTYVEAMEQNDLTFAIGPAGTGKTFLATVLAVRMLTERRIERLVLTRPAVEAGENLGFLPGDLKEKIDPYLRPLYDALYDCLPANKIQKGLENNTIEIAPLAFMRGRTLENAFVILDEAQNCNTIQMKMFLTRLGVNSKMVITGDPSQIDLPNNMHSGLLDAIKVTKNIKEIDQITFKSSDVVRHKLVAKIVNAYEKNK